MHVRPDRATRVTPCVVTYLRGQRNVCRGNSRRFQSSFLFFPPPRPRGVRRLINRSFHLIYDKYLHTYRKPLIATILSRFSDGCSHDYHHPFSSSFNCTLVTDRIFDDPLTHLKNGVRGNLSRQRGPLFQCDNGQLDGWDERESE